jgi:hypothetical protein
MGVDVDYEFGIEGRESGTGGGTMKGGGGNRWREGRPRPQKKVGGELG